MEKEREFPNWGQLYRDREVRSMPWFYPTLDPDLEQALRKYELDSGRVLDLGTGPGTQAMALAERGFTVTATDISEDAVKKAALKAKEKGLEILFQQDDILNSQLDQEFDFVFDRGCFHVLSPDRRADYVRIVSRLTKPGGYLFLKCFSHLETREGGPYRFTPAQIGVIFNPSFNVCSIEETVYHGTLETLPKALFCVMRKLK